MRGKSSGTKRVRPSIPLSRPAASFGAHRHTGTAISSDMYFERGSYDPIAGAEAQTRLQSFQGATSISSSQYFGRDADEEATAFPSVSGGGAGAGAGGGGYISEETLQNLGASARDAVQSVLANPDVQNIGESLRTGALKVSW
jgi:ADP-ribosylation factor GTPase-activating protein 2/3